MVLLGKCGGGVGASEDNPAEPGQFGESMGGEPSIITVTFNETNGITNVATSIKYASKADRDAAMSTGMTDGMEMSYKQLDGVLAG